MTIQFKQVYLTGPHITSSNLFRHLLAGKLLEIIWISILPPHDELNVSALSEVVDDSPPKPTVLQDEKQL